MDYSEIISALSAIAALLSALWASKSNRTAKMALEIAKRERDAKESHIDIYLSEIFSLKTRDKKKFVIASLIFTNKSEVSDGITRIELIVDYIVDGVVTNVVVGAGRHEIDSKAVNKIAIESPPFSISQRESASYWVCFEIPERVAGSKRINSYKIESTSASGAKNLLEPKVVGELFDE